MNEALTWRVSAQNRRWVCQMVMSQRAGQGAMPPALGLSAVDHAALLARYCPHLTLPAGPHGGEGGWQPPPEWEVLLELLLEQASAPPDEAHWMARLVATGCSGDTHLWEDLGLASRPELTRLMEHNFSALARANDRNMKWKKFLYRQLCQREGIVACPAPSCHQCAEYAQCFLDPTASNSP